MSGANDIENANKPWNGCWTVGAPADHQRGLYRVHQLTAHELLAGGAGRLTNAEAAFLQVVAYQWRDLGRLQRLWLDKLERQHGRWAA